MHLVEPVEAGRHLNKLQRQRSVALARSLEHEKQIEAEGPKPLLRPSCTLPGMERT